MMALATIFLFVIALCLISLVNKDPVKEATLKVIKYIVDYKSGIDSLQNK